MVAAVRGCKAGMAVVKQYQLEGVPASLEKSDRTLITVADSKSQAEIMSAFDGLPDISRWGEEGQFNGFRGNGRYGVIVDPLDGTNAFVSGMMTSTVIVGVYDRERETLVGCVIGEPATNRFWVATDSDTTISNGTSPCNVWRNESSRHGNVFVDVSHGFRSHGNQILTDEGNASLYRELQETGYRVLMPGSNGAMQALVANGREGASGSITTAVGFPGDVCGALLVRQAGGFCLGLCRRQNGSLIVCDALNSPIVDVLICANNPRIATQLTDMVVAVSG